MRAAYLCDGGDDLKSNRESALEEEEQIRRQFSAHRQLDKARGPEFGAGPRYWLHEHDGPPKFGRVFSVADITQQIAEPEG